MEVVLTKLVCTEAALTAPGKSSSHPTGTELIYVYLDTNIFLNKINLLKIGQHTSRLLLLL